VAVAQGCSDELVTVCAMSGNARPVVQQMLRGRHVVFYMRATDVRKVLCYVRPAHLALGA
jgi:hypothetical protein